MRAVTVSEPGGPEVLGWGEVPDPVCGPGEVVVDVAATRGQPRRPAAAAGLLPAAAGRLATSSAWSAAASISEVGEGVDRLGGRRRGVRAARRRRLRRAGRRPGRAAAARAGGRRAGRRRPRCPRWPARSGRTSSCSPACSRGETLLVHGGSSGIGTMAIQLAARASARGSFTTAGTAGEARRLPRAGRRRRASTTARRTSSSGSRRRPTARGADVILDNMGAKYLARNVDALAASGRLVIIGMQGGTKAELDLGALHGQARRGARDVAAARPADRPGGRRRSWRPCASTCGRDVERGASGRSSTAGCRCRAPPRRTGSSRPASTSARCCSLPED